MNCSVGAQHRRAILLFGIPCLWWSSKILRSYRRTLFELLKWHFALASTRIFSPSRHSHESLATEVDGVITDDWGRPILGWACRIGGSGECVGSIGKDCGAEGWDGRRGSTVERRSKLEGSIGWPAGVDIEREKNEDSCGETVGKCVRTSSGIVESLLTEQDAGLPRSLVSQYNVI